MTQPPDTSSAEQAVFGYALAEDDWDGKGYETVMLIRRHPTNNYNIPLYTRPQSDPQIEQDAKDAARYRHIRRRIPVQFDGEWLSPASPIDGYLNNGALDAAVDAELALATQAGTSGKDEK